MYIKNPIGFKTINMCSLQQTTIFKKWHFSKSYWTKNKKDAFLDKNKNLKKKIFFRLHVLDFLDSKDGKIQKSFIRNFPNFHSNLVNMVFFPNNSSYFLVLNLSDFTSDAQELRWDLPSVGAESDLSSWASKMKSDKLSTKK